MRTPRGLFGGSCLVLLGCWGGPGEGRATGIGTSASASAGGSSSGMPGEDEGSEADGSSGTGTGPRFDVGADSSGGLVGCSKVDFLFVVDDSQSMGDNQANLIGSFPVFAAGLEASLQYAEDVHIGVVTTDEYGALAPACNEIGALVSRTSGAGSSMAECSALFSGGSFMTQSDDLDEAFACAAQVGTAGLNRERPIDALLEVVRKTYDGPGGCNEGFLRDDALLVAVIISDEYDGPGDYEVDHSEGTPNEWYEEIVSLKGHPNNAAVVALVAGEEFGCPPGEDESDGGGIVTFARRFGANGLVSGICHDYDAVFSETIALVENSCSGYHPPG